MPVTTEDEPEDIDDDSASRVCAPQSSSAPMFTLPSQSALRIIDGLATNLPPSQVFPPLRDLILSYFGSPDPTHRRGAMLALGVSVEGCSEFMTPLMSQVWPIIGRGLDDPDASVRKATCVAVSCLCEWLEDECVAEHTTLVPVSDIQYYSFGSIYKYRR